MARGERVICASSALTDGGDGVRFELVDVRGVARAAFAIRHRGTVFAYLNRCVHVAMELDWNAGKFFAAEASVLICSTHGALYDPASGACRGGPCRGGGLVPVAVVERDGQVLLAATS